MHEFELINKYFSKLSKNNKGSLRLNDDVFFDKSKNLVISIDTYIQGTHFIDFKKPDLVIKKIIRSSISDLICKGVKPLYYFISGSGNKKTFSNTNLKKISKSLNQEQKKYKIFLCGGDTVLSNKLSFSITSVGFSKKIIPRNNAKLGDDIYVTGNLGDSYAGLKILKKSININKNLKKYFINKYYLPNLHPKLINKLILFTNTSIDISDGLITDLEKLIKLKKSNKKNFFSKGDDYQILFTANSSKSRIISKFSKTLNIKITKIGKICSISQKSQIIDQKGKKIRLKDKGYYHQF
jgi:thiamine-monophosphate kinase